jgi:hypothetical protein
MQESVHEFQRNTLNWCLLYFDFEEFENYHPPARFKGFRSLPYCPVVDVNQCILDCENSSGANALFGVELPYLRCSLALTQYCA